jgi:hypothetical protein
MEITTDQGGCADCSDNSSGWNGKKLNRFAPTRLGYRARAVGQGGRLVADDSLRKSLGHDAHRAIRILVLIVILVINGRFRQSVLLVALQDADQLAPRPAEGRTDLSLTPRHTPGDVVLEDRGTPENLQEGRLVGSFTNPDFQRAKFIDRLLEPVREGSAAGGRIVADQLRDRSSATPCPRVRRRSTRRATRGWRCRPK